MKHDLTTGTWQDDTGCPISIVLAATSDVGSSTVHDDALESILGVQRSIIREIIFDQRSWNVFKFYSRL